MSSRFTNLEFTEQQADDARIELELASNTPTRPESLGRPPSDAASFLANANQARHSGSHEIALRLYTRALGEDRALIPAWVGQIQMLVQLGEYREARLWSDKAIELFPRQGDLHAAKAQACARQGDRDTAMACSDASINSDGSSVWRWQARGEVLLARSQPHYRDCFERAAAEPDALWFDHLVTAEALRYYHHAADAMRHVQRALAEQADHAYAWFLLGGCQADLGWSADAATSFDRCLEIDRGIADRVNAESRAGRSGWRQLWRRWTSPRSSD